MNTSKLVINLIFVAASFNSMAAPPEKEMPIVAISAPQTGANSGEAYMGYTGFVSTKTRAEVLQEFRDAKLRGEIYSGESYPGPFSLQTHLTRAEVAAELKEYQASHPNETDDGAFYPFVGAK